MYYNDADSKIGVIQRKRGDTVNKLKELRKAAGLTQQEVAMHFGLNRAAVAMWERGASVPKVHILPELAKLLGCSIDELFKEGKD